VTIIGRRGPYQAAYTVKELRDLTKINGANFQFDKRLITDEFDELLPFMNKHHLRRNKRVKDVLEASLKTPKDGTRNLILDHYRVPKFISNENDRLVIDIKRTKLEIKKEGTSATYSLIETDDMKYECDLVLKSIGYSSMPIDDVPFDSRRSLIPNERGRVIDESKGVFTCPEKH
jgi:hypothetical protein